MKPLKTWKTLSIYENPPCDWLPRLPGKGFVFAHGLFLWYLNPQELQTNKTNIGERNKTYKELKTWKTAKKIMSGGDRIYETREGGAGRGWGVGGGVGRGWGGGVGG